MRTWYVRAGLIPLVWAVVPGGAVLAQNPASDSVAILRLLVRSEGQPSDRAEIRSGAEIWTSDARGQVRLILPIGPRTLYGTLTLSWEPRDQSGIGVEGFYTGPQPLADDPYRTGSRPNAIFGATIRWRVGPAMLFVNSEDLFDVRQTRYGPLLRPSPGLGGRWTVDAWAPLDGRVVNGGVRIRFGEPGERDAR